MPFIPGPVSSYLWQVLLSPLVSAPSKHSSIAIFSRYIFSAPVLHFIHTVSSRPSKKWKHLFFVSVDRRRSTAFGKLPSLFHPAFLARIYSFGPVSPRRSNSRNVFSDATCTIAKLSFENSVRATMDGSSRCLGWGYSANPLATFSHLGAH